MHNPHDMQNEQQGQDDRLLTTRDVQSLVNVDRSTIYRMAEDGRIPAIKVGRQWRFPERAIRSWLAGDRPVPGHDTAAGNGDSLPPAGVLQALAELVSRATGAMVVIADPQGNPLTEVANPCGYFRAVASDPATLERCIEGWREYGEDPDLLPHFAPSHLGFLCARGFARIGSELSAMIIVGGIAPENWPPPAADLARVADDLGIPAALLEEHVDQVYHLDDDERRRILDLLPRVGVLISQISSDRSRLHDRLESIAALASNPSRRSTS
jgi:excisionase family DNA binding protein